MATFANTLLIARYTMRLVWRDKLFFVLTVVLLASTGLFHILYQSNSGEAHNSYHTLASFVPYMNAFVWNLLLILPLLSLTGGLLHRQREVDTMAPLLAHPESNLEYLSGVALGLLGVLLETAVCSLLLAGGVHLFGSHAPFSGWLYLFYLLAWMLPAAGFMIGLICWLTTHIAHRGVNLILLLGYFSVNLFFIAPSLYGIMDPLGFYLPNIFSDFTGHPNLSAYLVQRVSWLLAGGGLFLLSAAKFKRLPNRPAGQRRYRLSGSCLLLLWVGGILVLLSAPETREQRRQHYTQAYDRYSGYPKASLTSQDISYHQHGSQIAVTTTLKITNRHAQVLDTLLLYLNPLLEMDEIRVDGEPRPYRRDHQVVLINYPLAPSQETTLTLTYRGEVDEAICYLDLPETDTPRQGYLSCSFGSDYIYLNRRYTLLIPECLWYPVTVPPVNPRSPLQVERPFCQYTLTLAPPKGKTAISQGERIEQGGEVMFRNDHPLTGISLCIGDYRRYTASADGIRYEMYLKPEHHSILTGTTHLGESLPILLRKFQQHLTVYTGQGYAFRRFVLLETPISFTSRFRTGKGGSEYIQPEWVLFPERMTGWKTRIPLPAETPEEEHMVLLVIKNLLSEKPIAPHRSILNRFLPLPGEEKINPFLITPLFYEQVLAFRSVEYPVIDRMLLFFLKRARAWKNSVGMFSSSPAFEAQWNAREYLKNGSVRSALSNASLSPAAKEAILELKTEAFVHQLLFHSGASRDSLYRFIADYGDQYRFQEIDFSDFNRTFNDRWRVDWNAVLSSWYHEGGLPAFIVRKLSISLVDPAALSPTERVAWNVYRVEAEVLNTGTVSGLISFDFNSVTSGKRDIEEIKRDLGKFMTSVGTSSVISRVTGNRRMQDSEKGKSLYYLLPPHRGSKIAFLLKERTSRIHLNTLLAQNLPSEYELECWGEHSVTANTTTWCKEIPDSLFFSSSNEWIVDNEDPGFRVCEPATQRRWLQWFQKTQQQGVPTYRTKGSPPKVSEKWHKTICETAYGEVIKSYVSIQAGTGDSWVEWHQTIEQPGWYELFVFLSRDPQDLAKKQLQRGETMSISAILDSSQEQLSEPIYQYYNIQIGEEEQEVAVDLRMNEPARWVSLGKFELPPGNHVIRLSNRGDKLNRVIFADAAKWVLIRPALSQIVKHHPPFGYTDRLSQCLQGGLPDGIDGGEGAQEGGDRGRTDAGDMI